MFIQGQDLCSEQIFVVSIVTRQITKECLWKALHLIISKRRCRHRMKSSHDFLIHRMNHISIPKRHLMTSSHESIAWLMISSQKSHLKKPTSHLKKSSQKPHISSQKVISKTSHLISKSHLKNPTSHPKKSSQRTHISSQNVISWIFEMLDLI